MSYKVSNTAYGVTRVRCFEMFYPPEQRLFEDPYSIRFLPSFTRLLIQTMRWSWLRDFYLWLWELILPGLVGGMLCRTRYIDDIVHRCLDDGIRTIINLGAGLDTRGFRLPALAQSAYYEVDLVELIAYKRKKIEDLYGRMPDHLRLVAVDFQNQSLEERLHAEGFRREERALFILEGLIQYIDPEAFHDLLKFLSQAADDSRVVFTYPMQDFLDGSKDYGKISRLIGLSRRSGSAFNNGQLPETLPKVLAPYSLTLIEDVDAEYYQRTLLKGLNRKLNVFAIERVAFAGVH